MKIAWFKCQLVVKNLWMIHKTIYSKSIIKNQIYISNEVFCIGTNIYKRKLCSYINKI